MSANNLILLILCIGFITTSTLTPKLTKMNEDILNDRPIIGILTQEIGGLIDVIYPGHNYKSYLSASYVKFVEGSGARAIPLWIGQPRIYYQNILSKINGILLPGGARDISYSKNYDETSRHIIDIAKDMNDNGNYFPIWGTALGFELLILCLLKNGTEPRSICESQMQPLPLEFEKGYETSRLFGKAPANIIEILEKENVTTNFQMHCITNWLFEGYDLGKEWKILSYNHDNGNVQFISTIEHHKYPFYGVQFNPEKNIYEFILNTHISHTANAIQVSQYFADFFINESRKNLNKFPTKIEEDKSLIYNYSPLFTERKGYVYEQKYLFEEYKCDSSINDTKIQ